MWVRKLRDLVVHNVLGLDDTPHRIAMGVFWGVFVAWTPTIGIQTGLYLALASLGRANRMSGLPIIMVSNPVTAVPIYYANWWVGAFLLHGGRVDLEAGKRFVDAQVKTWTSSEGGNLLQRLLTAEFWLDLARSLLEVGVELWVGSVVVGALAGLGMYSLTRRAIVRYRARHPHRRRVAPTE